MKVKEIDRTSNIAWSPSAHHPIYLATGTAAQQLDATFNTTASLEIYDLNLTEPCLDMTLKGSIVSDYRFHKIVWGCVGMKNSEMTSGLIVGGTDGGNILMYDPAKLIAGEDALLHHKTKHSGPVNSLDFNKFQECLLASGSSESEIFIWDLNNPSTPMPPGIKSQPTDDVTCVAWNWQVQHILASTFPARCVVWDLRKNEPIIKVSDSAARLHCKMVAWHPEVATQLCLASDDDHRPLIQLWDLRFATTPVQNLEHHQRGVLSIAWCPQDPDLLLSCGKDNRIFCWNPNSSVEGGEVVCELPTSSQWSFDVAWCPRNPAVIASSSCDGHVSVYSLMGGQQQAQCSSKIAESFPGSDKMVQPHVAAPTQRHVSVSLQKPPKWLRKPVGASFSFGGKLISFSNERATSQQSVPQVQRYVHLSSVITEPGLLAKAATLEAALGGGDLIKFCLNKSDSYPDSHEKMKWNFLEATFSTAPRAKMLSLLGYDYQRVMTEMSKKVGGSDSKVLAVTEDLAGKMSQLGTHSEFPVSSASSEFDRIIEKSVDRCEKAFSIKASLGDVDGLLTRALLTGNVEAAVELCLQDERWTDALILAQAGGHDLLQKTQKLYFSSVESSSSKLISAVATSDWLSVIKNCEIESWKEALAAILTYAKPEEFAVLCELLGTRLETENNGDLMHNAALCYISAGNLDRLAELWTKENQSDVSSLQSLVEQIMILRHAVERLSGNVPPLQSGTLSALLSQFAALLASQGNLKSAVIYLSDSKEESCVILRDRIYQALGHPSPHFPFKLVEIQKAKMNIPVQAQDFSRKNSLQDPHQSQFYPQAQQHQYRSYAPLQPVSGPSYPFSNAPNQPQYQAPSVPPVSVPHGNVLQYQAPAPPPPLAVTPATSMPQSTVLTTTSFTFPPVDQSGKISSGHHISQRYPKHLHDPSVYTENTYSNQYQPYSTLQPQMSSLSQPITQQAMNYYSTEQSTLAFSSSCTMPTYPSAPYSSYQNQVSQHRMPEPLPHPPVAMQSFPSAYGEMKTGWNDPPLLKQTASQPATYEAPPITVPLVGALVPDVPQPTSIAHPIGYAGAQLASQLPMQPLDIAGESPMIAASSEVPDSPKEKDPIPEKYLIITHALEDLRVQCHSATRNPQTRRKLEDVAKKLESLYDECRNESLSKSVFEGLRDIAHAIIQSDFSAALHYHGEIVSSTNFSEISGFMPSVKVLLKTASQLCLVFFH